MALRELLARFGFQFDNKKVEQADKSIAGAVNRLHAFGAVIAGSAIVSGIASFVKDTQVAGDAIGKTAARLGVGTTELQRWKVAAESAGVSGEEFDVALKSLQKNAANANAGEKGLAKTFKDLGVELTDSSGKMKSATVLMRETGLALNKLDTDTERVAISQKLMEESGFKLLTLFKGQAEGLDAMLAILDDYGGGFGPQAVKASEDLGDAFLKAEVAMTSARGALAAQVFPALSELVTRGAKVVGAIVKWIEKTQSLRSILIAVGLVLGKLAVAQFGASLLKLGAAALVPLLKLALLILVVDDFIALLEGRGSVIGTALDKLFGAGTSEKTSAAIRKIGSAFGDLISGDFKSFSDKLDEVFGPPGQAIVKELVEGFLQLEKDVNAWSDRVEADFEQAIADIVAMAKQLGSDFIDGILEGLNLKSGEVSSNISGIMSRAIADARSAIQAKSPAKVPAKLIGEPFMQGIGMGALGAANDVLRDVERATTVALSPKVMTAPALAKGSAGAAPTVMQQNDITINVGRGDVQSIRQGLREPLAENRRAMLAALVQRAPNV